MFKRVNSISALRIEMHMSQKEFANLLGVTQTSLSYYESGRRKPSWRITYMIKKIAKVAGIYIDLENIHPE